MMAPASLHQQEQQQTSSSSADTICVPAAIRQLVAQIVGPGVDHHPNALSKAWTQLLDLDSSRLQAVEDVPDRRQANAEATSQACSQLSQSLRSADAEQLQQLVQQWARGTHYVTRLGAGQHHQGFAAVPLTEHQAVLSLLLALRGSCPASPPALTTLPALGSSLLQSLQHEAQSAAAAAPQARGSGNSSGGWVAMSAQPEALLLQPTRGGSASNSVQEQQDQEAAGQAAAAAGSWVSPAAAAMQLLQQMPLNPTAAGNDSAASRWQQQQGAQEPVDDILIAAACGDGSSSSTSTAGNAALAASAQHSSQQGPKPLLQHVGRQMQLASSAALLGRPLGACNTSSTSSSSRQGPAAGRLQHPSSSRDAAATAAVQHGKHVVSAVAAEAEAAVKAVAGIQPRIASLMQLSSGQPGLGSGKLLPCDDQQQPTRSNKSSSTAAAAKDTPGGSRGSSDTAQARDADGAKQNQQQHMGRARRATAAGALSSSSTKSCQEVEAELLSTSCLALQGVWSAVQQLWDVLLREALVADGGGRGGFAGAGGSGGGDAGNAPAPRRTLGLCRSAVQGQLLMQVLHTAELRLRLQAFLQHVQHSNSNEAAGAAAGPDAAARAVQTAFAAAVTDVLAQHDACMATGQVSKLLQAGKQQQRQPNSSSSSPTLVQLLAVQRGMARQLQQLAELCWCTVDEFVGRGMCFKGAALPSREVLPSSISSSSMMLWHVLRRRNTRRNERAAAAAALADAAAEAAQEALPWPSSSSGGQAEAAAAVQRLGWAPSSWQLRQGFDGGHGLLERLYSGLLQASPEAAPLLRHLFAAAVQPVLQSLHAWAFMPDTEAAEAAAEATAMASFTASSSGGSKGTDATAIIPSGSSGGGSAASKPWSGSKAAEAAMRECLQHAWRSICERPPGCPSFLAHVQQPAAVAGLQLHLLQLLGGPGQALANRLGCLAEFEQQELLELLNPAGAAAATAQQGFVAKGQGAGPFAAAGEGASCFMGLLCSGAGGSGGSIAARAGGGRTPGPQGGTSISPTCNLSTQQLTQCAAVVADYEAARSAELQLLLQGLAQRRAAGQAAHELWLASRQEQKQEAEAACLRLQAEAASRRKARQQQLLEEQQQEMAAVETRRLAARLQELSAEQQLLQQAAAHEHQQALLQLQAELALVQSPAAAATTGVAAVGLAPAKLVSGFAAAAAAAAPPDDEAVDADSIMLDVLGADAAAAAAADGQQQQQREQQRQRGTWGRPVLDLGPAAGAPSGGPGAAAAGPLAVIGSAAAPPPVQAAGRRSNSQPKILLPGMGRPLSASSSRRNSSSGEDAAALAAAAAAASGVGAGGILGGFGAASIASKAAGVQAKGRWGVPVVPSAAAGVAGGPHHSLQRQQSAGRGWAAAGGSSSSRPGTPAAGRRESEHAGQNQLTAADGADVPSASAAAASVAGGSGAGWLLSRSQLRASENQGNTTMMGWLLQQSGLCCTAAAGPAGPACTSSTLHAQADAAEQQPPAAAAAPAAAGVAGAAAAGAAGGTGAVPVVASLSVLVVQPLLAQQRLTTQACWSLLLQEHRLLQRLGAIQGLFFQQQGDWVLLLCDALEPLLQQQQQRKQAGSPADAIGGVLASPVVLQLLLEAAVSQSCLAGAPEAERLSLQAVAGRSLAGWVGSRGQHSSSSSTAAATDGLLLSCDVPWPVSLLLGDAQLQRYADVFSVLLRLRRLQQQLTKQWQPLNSRASARAPGELQQQQQPRMQRHASERGRGLVGSRDGNAAAAARRTTWHGSGVAAAGAQPAPPPSAAATEGLCRLQDLRRWHALAQHCVSGLLGYMLGELSGQLQEKFEAAIGSSPVDLPVMLQAHEQLLQAAQQVCLLPPKQQQTQQQRQDSIASLAYALVDAAWELQQQVDAVLLLSSSAAATGSNRVEAPLSGFKEGVACSGLAAVLLLGGGDDDVWEPVEAAGAGLQRVADALKQVLKSSVSAVLCGHPLAALAARLGV